MDGRFANEIREAPLAVARQRAALAAPLRHLVGHLEQKPPGVVVTCARGSSAHAATFAKHFIEHHLGIPVAAAAPSIVTVYDKRLNLDGQLFLAISQSGRSDDLVETATAARSAGAITAALVNDTESPLAASCEIVLPMAAGVEHSVAATKTFIGSLSAVLRLVAAWSDDAALADALDRLPDRLAASIELDWTAPLAALASAASLVTIGRGPTLAIAREASLKLKEICNLHAEAFSGAEFLHGPVALVSTRYPVLLFMPSDAAAPGLRRFAADLRRKNATLLVAEPGEAAPGRLPALEPDHSGTDAICLIQSFYVMAGRLAALIGTDVDQPRHLQKITRTR